MSREPLKEYVFTLPDGTKRYEFVDTFHGVKEVAVFMKMHGAIRGEPIKNQTGE